MPKANLIIQAQRMGDMILSFPLMLWMFRQDPSHELWVAGEQQFFEPLMGVSPPVTYFPLSAAGKLKRAHYGTVVNLSHRPEAAALAGGVQAERVLGRMLEADGSLRVRGFWHLYRAGLVENNRYNPFHWADLNGLDLVDASIRGSVRWPRPGDNASARSGRVGLFLGASQEEKLPHESFWAELCRELMQRKLKPVLLGGPAEKARGVRVHKELGGMVPDLSDRLSLRELAEFLRSCQTLITPDTGPMHLASWLGTQVVDLSVGPVNPWETGPYQPGHFVLEPRMSCTGCWSCAERGYRCRAKFRARDVAYGVHRVVGTGRPGQTPPGLRVFESGRDSHHLFALNPTAKNSAPTARDALRFFWKTVWLRQGGLGSEDDIKLGWSHLTASHPALQRHFKKGLARLAATFKARREAVQSETWRTAPVLMRPLSGTAQLMLENDDFSQAAYKSVYSLFEILQDITA